MPASSANLAALWMLEVSQDFLYLFFFLQSLASFSLSQPTVVEVSTFRQIQKCQVRVVH